MLNKKFDIKLSNGPSLEDYIKKYQAMSFLDQNAEMMRTKKEDVERVNAVLGDYAQRQNLANNILNLIPTPGARIQARIPPKPPQTQNFNPLSLAVVPAFLKLRRREAIKKEMDAGNIYDKSSRIDPDDKQIPGITDKVKQKRAEVIDSWNPEYQKLIRYQAENLPDGVSAGRRGGVFYTPNYDNTMYKGGLFKTIGSEGGDNRIEKTKKINNPLILYRDAGEFIGKAGLKKLLGTDNIFLRRPQTISKINKNYELTQTPLKVNKYPKWLESTLKSKKEANKRHKAQNLNTPKPFPEIDGYSVNDENVVNEAARRAGYDSVVALRKKTHREKSIIDTPIKGNFSLLDENLKPVAVYKPPTKTKYQDRWITSALEFYTEDLKNKYTTKKESGGWENYFLHITPTELKKFLAPSTNLHKQYISESPPYTAAQLVELDAAREKEKIAQKIQPLVKNPNPLPKTYEELLDEILKQKLIKYKKESKPK